MILHLAPNEGIRRSFRNAMFIGSASALLFGVVMQLIDYFWFSRMWGEGLEFGVIIGMLIGLRSGGFACLQHVILRLVLWYHGYAPWHYVRFLEFAAQRVLMRKVGGGYIFIHRLLLEYFVTLA